MDKQSRRTFLKSTLAGTAAAAAVTKSFGEVLTGSPDLASGRSTGGQGAGDVVSLPKPDGSLKGMGENFKPNPFTGTANLSVPIATSPGRGGFGPSLSLSYSSGNSQGPFGMGWSLSIPEVSRKTSLGIPKYNDGAVTDASNKDTFILSGTEDLVERLDVDQLGWPKIQGDFKITYFRPRVEGLFAKIEKWERITGSEVIGINNRFWKTTSKENICSVYGFTENAVLGSGSSVYAKIFKWLLEFSFDLKGNYIYYEYKPDFGDNVSNEVFELHRAGANQKYQSYIKNIRYGNTDPYVYNGFTSLKDILFDNPPDGSKNFFNIVFDYGEHSNTRNENGLDHAVIPDTIYTPHKVWDCRADPFSDYTSGIEIRTYRVCKRIMTFHQIPREVAPTLVKSTDFNYTNNDYNFQTTLASVTQRGYRKKKETGWARSEEFYLSVKEPGIMSDIYSIKSLPPLEFKYSRYEPGKTSFKPLEFEDGDFPPTHLGDRSLALVDLFRRALPDILQTTKNGYYYYQNKGDGKFSRRRKLNFFPAGVTLDMQGVGFGDITGNGSADLLVHHGAAWGFYESDEKKGWKNFRKYKQAPTFSLDDPNIKMIDLTGDGKSDVLRTDDQHFVYFKCKGEDGFDEPAYVSRKKDPAVFPDVFFSDSRTRLADMSGDGLQDIVVARSNTIEYYPNLGDGIFGKRVTMKGCPHFGADFDPGRLFLVDVDGSGPCDLVYVESGKVHLWFNQSGNGFSQRFDINGTPKVSNTTNIQFADLLGNGTNCLVISDNFSAGRSNVFFLDFTSSIKPNIIVEMNNNMGMTTRASYKSSTYFMLQDERMRPWFTSLPFPVQVLEQLEFKDSVSGTKSVNRFAYHHGYYESNHEKEFRGFAAVDQWDSELIKTGSGENNSTNVLRVPPVLTKTWYHTGAFDEQMVSDDLRALINSEQSRVDLHDLFSGDYYNKDEKAFDLASSGVENLVVDEKAMCEAYRAMTGNVLRQEVYSLDENETLSPHPYTVSDSKYLVKSIQEKSTNKKSVFYSYLREMVSYNYERNPADPRITHKVTLGVDLYGNVTDVVSISYPRRTLTDSAGQLIKPPFPEQLKDQIVYTHSEFINKVHDNSFYCTSIKCEDKVYELQGLVSTANQPFDRSVFAPYIDIDNDPNPHPVMDHNWQRPGNHSGVSKRMLKWSRTYFRTDNSAETIDISISATGEYVRSLNNRLRFRDINALMLPYETFHAAYSKSMVNQLYGTNRSNNKPKVTDQLLKTSGYHEENNYWWIPDGQQAFEKKSFYLPKKNVNALGNGITIEYENNLLVASTTDAMNNVVTLINDYYALQPQKTTDQNGNTSEVAFDAMGVVAATAVMGKGSQNVGDSLDGLEAAPGFDVLYKHIEDPLTNSAGDLLQRASTRIVYDLWRGKRLGDPSAPCASYTISRLKHNTDLAQNEVSPLKRTFMYFDGNGRAIQIKQEAKSERDNSGKILWTASGWVVPNNKGNEVFNFESFHTLTHTYEADHRIGVSSVKFYDPLQRLIAVLHPNHTYEKVEFNAWEKINYDVNDTVCANGRQTGDPRTDKAVGGFVKSYFETLPPNWETWYQERINGGKGQDEKKAAEKASVHADTPLYTNFDPMQRPFLTCLKNRSNLNNVISRTDHETHFELDIEGNQLEIRDGIRQNGDTKGRLAARYYYNMAGRSIGQSSPDAGDSFLLMNVVGKNIRAWTSRGFTLATYFDVLDRPMQTAIAGVDQANPDKFLVMERLVYGEHHPQATQLNLRGKLFLRLDQSGYNASDEYDFKGNAIRSTRKFATEYKSIIDWGIINASIPALPATVNLANLTSALTPFLQSDTYVSSAKYDAGNRPVQIIPPHKQTGSTIPVIQPGYTVTDQLQRLDVWLNQTTAPASLIDPQTVNPARVGVVNIEYNARGQRTAVRYKNDVTTRYQYDPDTFLLKHLYTKRNHSFVKDCGPNPNTTFAPDDAPGGQTCGLQNLHYTYDPAGNVTNIRDDAQQTIYFRNKIVEPKAEFTYDAIYQLIEAKAREHLGQINGTPISHSYNDLQRMRLSHPEDGNAMGTYIEQYEYDLVGNLLSMNHKGTSPVHPGWKRTYQYAENSLLEPGKKSNRLTSTTLSNGSTETYSTNGDGYDANGNMLRQPHLSVMQWNFNDMLQMSQRQAINAADTPGTQAHGERTWYVYDASGERARKVTELANGQIRQERFYFAGFETFRRYGANALERETLHIKDEQQTIALIDTRTSGSEPNVPAQLFRNQLANHLGSAALEVNENAQIISYEEYTPYGSTAYQAVTNQTHAPSRYRYTGKERDEETGFYYNGARYVIPWLGRWLSTDKLGFVDSLSLYVYAKNQPLRFVDPDGAESKDVNPKGWGARMWEKVSGMFRSQPPAAEREASFDQWEQPDAGYFAALQRSLGVTMDTSTDPPRGLTGPMLRDAMMAMKAEGTKYFFPKQLFDKGKAIPENFRTAPMGEVVKFGKTGTKAEQGTTNCSNAVLEAIFRVLGGSQQALETPGTFDKGTANPVAKMRQNKPILTEANGGAVNGVPLSDKKFQGFAEAFVGKEWVDALENADLGRRIVADSSTTDQLMVGDIIGDGNHRFLYLETIEPKKVGNIRIKVLDANISGPEAIAEREREYTPEAFKKLQMARMNDITG